MPLEGLWMEYKAPKSTPIGLLSIYVTIGPLGSVWTVVVYLPTATPTMQIYHYLSVSPNGARLSFVTVALEDYGLGAQSPLYSASPPFWARCEITRGWKVCASITTLYPPSHDVVPAISRTFPRISRTFPRISRPFPRPSRTFPRHHHELYYLHPLWRVVIGEQ